MSSHRCVLAEWLALFLLSVACCGGCNAGGGDDDSSSADDDAAGDDDADDDAADDELGPVPPKIESGGQWHMTDEFGRALIFHGVNVTDDIDENTWTPSWGRVSREDFERMAALGFNFVRLQRFWSILEPTKGQYDEAYLERTQELLDLCDEFGLNAVIDNHQDIYSPGTGGRGAPEWAVRTDNFEYHQMDVVWWLNNVQPAVMQAWLHFWNDADIHRRFVAMWQEYARRFGQHPAVIGYDLINEPFQGWALAWVARWEATVLTPAYQGWIDAIRQVDRRNWIFYEPVSWIVNTSLWPSHAGPVDDEKAVYFPHMYWIVNDMDEPWGGDPGFIYAWEGRARERANAQQGPLMCGEFGVNPDIPGHLAFLFQQTKMFNRASSGWAYWEWGYVRDHLDQEDESPRYRTFIDELAQPYPRAIAGAPLKVLLARDPASLTIQFRPDPRVTAPTEIFVSAKRWFPNGFTVYSTDSGDAWSYEYDEASETLSVTNDPHATWTQIVVAAE